MLMSSTDVVPDNRSTTFCASVLQAGEAQRGRGGGYILIGQNQYRLKFE